MPTESSEERAAWLENLICDFIETSPENNLGNGSDEKAFEKPLVGFARGDDPLFESYKQHVGDFHWTPLEIFDKIKCLNHLRPATAEYVKANYGFDGYGCGLCQTGVPCEFKIPARKEVRS